ncbi:CFEM domain-containing protein [Seiridium cupressi]
MKPQKPERYLMVIIVSLSWSISCKQNHEACLPNLSGAAIGDRALHVGPKLVIIDVVLVVLGSSAARHVGRMCSRLSGSGITFGVISAASVLARLGFKILVQHMQPSLDDWFILITFLSGLPSTIVNTELVIPSGLGRDLWTLTSTQITDFGMYFYVMAILYFLQVTLLKMSLLFFYLRIFPEKMIKRLLWGTVWFNAAFGLFFVVLTIFQCQPVSFYWTKWDGEHEGKCIGINGIAWANAGISIALDIWMLAIPLSQLRKLQLHWKKKVGVALMFIVGAFVTVVSILRLQSLVIFADTENPSWDYLGVSNWSVVEINVGIICACMPSLRVILVRIFPSLGGTTRAANQYYQSGSRTGNKSKVRSRAGTGGQMPSIVHYPEPRKGIVQQRTYTVQYDDSDEQSLVHMQDLDSKGTKSRSTSEMSV